MILIFIDQIANEKFFFISLFKFLLCLVVKVRFVIIAKSIGTFVNKDNTSSETSLKPARYNAPLYFSTNSQWFFPAYRTAGKLLNKVSHHISINTFDIDFLSEGKSKVYLLYAR